jgi:sulfite exporter TauE/SafE
MGAALGLAGALTRKAMLVPVLACPSCGPRTLHWTQQIPMIAAGVLIIVLGLGMLGWLPFTRRLEQAAHNLPPVRRAMQVFREGAAGLGVYYPMGMAFGFIPCGLVYSVLATAGRAGMDAGNPVTGLLEGGMLMVLFGTGTIAPMALFGRVASLLGARMRTRLYRLSAVLVLAMGIVFLVRALR